MRSAKQPNLQENPVNSLKNLHIPTDAILQGDSLAVLTTLPDSSVHCCVTSPPYYALRDYGVEGQIGREATPEAYIRRLVEVFREVYRVLRKDGTVWLYTDETPTVTTTVPDFREKTVAQVNQSASSAGINVQLSGITAGDGEPKSLRQSVAPGSKVPKGTVVNVEFIYEDTVH